MKNYYQVTNAKVSVLLAFILGSLIIFSIFSTPLAQFGTPVVNKHAIIPNDETGMLQPSLRNKITSTSSPTLSSEKTNYALLFSSVFQSQGVELTDTGAMLIARDDSILIGGSTTAQDIIHKNPYDSSFSGGTTDALLIQYLSTGELFKSTYFGGNGEDSITNIVQDSVGNVIIAGVTTSSDLPVVSSTFDAVANGNSDVFVAKFSYAGDLLWSTYLGGSHQDIVHDLLVDNLDNIFLTGSTESSNFPVTGNSTASGGLDGFLTSFSSDGSLRFSRYFGGSLDDWFSSLVLVNDSLVLAGVTASSDINFPNNKTYTINNNSDMFLVGFNKDGTIDDFNLIYGGNGTEIPSQLVVFNGYYYTAGTTTSNDLTGNLAPEGENGFVAKFSTMGNNVWTTYLGGNGSDKLFDMTLVNSQLAITGATEGNGFPILNGYDTTHNGNFDVLITTLDPADGSLLKSSYLGGIQADHGYNIAYDSLNNTIVSGVTNGAGFPQTHSNSFLNTSDIFLTKFSNTQDPFIVNSFGGVCTAKWDCQTKFYLAWDVVVGQDNNLYITDLFNDRIAVISQSGQFIKNWNLSSVQPAGIAQKTDGHFFVSNPFGLNILEFTAGGTLNKTLSVSTETYDLDYNGTHLLVPDYLHDVIWVLDENGNQVDTIGSPGTGNGQFDGLYSAVYHNGFIYASDISLHRILKFTASGQYVSSWGQLGSGIGEFNEPSQIAISNNLLYVTDFNNNRIQVFTLDGQFVTLWAGSTTSKNNFKNPVGITFNSSGYMIVNDISDQKIITFNPIGVVNILPVGFEYISRYDYSKEYYIANNITKGFDVTNNYNDTNKKYLYLLEPSEQKIKKFEVQLDLYFLQKYGVAYYRPYLVATIGSSGSNPGQFLQFEDITLNSTDDYYVTDSVNNRISIFASNDTFIKSFGMTGSENGNFSSPKGIVYSSFNKYIYVVDNGNNRVQYFDWNGTYKGKFGSNIFTDPYDVAINSKSGYVYVTDKGSDQIHVFNATGVYKFSFGSTGNLAGELNNPGHLVVDSRQLVHVMDSGNKRLVTFDKDGNYKTFENQWDSGFSYSTLNGIAVDKDDNLYFNWGMDYVLKFNKIETQITKSASPYYTFSYATDLLSTAFDPYGKFITVGTLDNNIVKFDVSSKTLLSSNIDAHSNPILALDYTEDGKILASGGADNIVKLWYQQENKTVTLQGHNGQITAIKFFSNDQKLASSSGDQTIKVWNVSSGELLMTLKNHTQAVLDIAISPDNSKLISASMDHTLKVWNLSSGQVIKTITGHTDQVTGVDFSPDGKFFVSVSYDRRVILWDAIEYRQVQQMLLHTGRITSVAFNPDGKEFASGDENGKIYVWDMSTKKASWFLDDHTEKIWDLTYSPDGTFLISGSADNSVRLWNIPSSDVANDLDRDGMDDHWETLYGLSPFDFGDKFLDADNDGIINSIEYRLGSNPLSNDTDSDNFSDILEFTSGLNPIYNDNLDDLDGDGINNIYEFNFGLDFKDPADASRDLDNDGLSNLQEFLFGSFVNSTDTDHDKLPDAVEFQYGLLPTINDANADLDNDSMPNLYEYTHGLNLSMNDSLGDLDNDQMTNLFEFTYNFDPSDPSDANLDADGDGFTNLEEFLQGTNPRDANDPYIPPVQTENTTTPPYDFFSDPTVVTLLTVSVISAGVMGGALIVYRKKFKPEF